MEGSKGHEATEFEIKRLQQSVARLGDDNSKLRNNQASDHARINELESALVGLVETVHNARQAAPTYWAKSYTLAAAERALLYPKH